MTTSTRTELASRVISLEEKEYKSESLWRTALRRLRRDRLTMVALTYLVILTAVSFSAPLFERTLGVSYTKTNPTQKQLPVGTWLETTNPDGSIKAVYHFLGTDNLGRDEFARLLRGGQISLTIGVIAAVFSAMIGSALGLLTGYYQGTAFGFIDDFIMWFITTLNSIPTLMLLILIASVFKPTIATLIFVLVFVSWSGTMRLIRGETLSHREAEYVIGARAVGASAARIMFVHILPNTLSVLITSIAISIGGLILTESALSFLGLGVRPPDPSWGNMLNEAQAVFRQAAHLAIIPGLLISTTVLCMYLIGDGLRDAFDPRSIK
jgi:peptide/nickel transport system permease protein